MRWRVYLVVGGLLLLLLAITATTTVVRLRSAAIGQQLTDVLRPAQMAADELTTAYVDEETGERGYLLTHDDSFLQPYYSGEQAAAHARGQLAGAFAGDPVLLRMLSDVDAAAHEWRTRAVDPELSEFRSETLTNRDLVLSVGLGKTLFNELRARLAALENRISQQVGVAVQESSAAQTAANDITIGAAVVALALAGLAIWQLRTSFAVPLNRLVRQVGRVSGGDVDHSVDVTGPLEVTTVGRSVEAMRVRILAESSRSSAAARQVARYEEAERIARSIGDTVLRQLFTTSLTLQSAAGRYPAVKPILTSAINDIDAALKALQSAIFELTATPGQQTLGQQVLDLVAQLEAARGTAPDVQFAGRLDSDAVAPVAADVIAVIRDTLGGPADESAISLSVDGDTLHLRITWDRVEAANHGPPDALPGIRARAEQLGGTCSVERHNGSVVVDWQVPIRSGHE